MRCESVLTLALAEFSSVAHRLALHFPSRPTCCYTEALQMIFSGGETVGSVKCLQTQGLEFDSQNPCKEVECGGLHP